jgi:chromosome partitioning protein
MVISVVSFKGGVGKTTTSIHLAAYLQRNQPTLLVDGDPNRSCLDWASRWIGPGSGLPFKVIDEKQLAKHARHFDHIVADTQARPEMKDLKSLAEGCDLLVIPSTPDALSLSALLQTVETLQALKVEHFKILLTIIPPKPSRDGEEAVEMLKARGLPAFKNSIRRFVAFQKAALAGVTVDQVRDDHAVDGAADYLAVGREIIK